MTSSHFQLKTCKLSNSFLLIPYIQSFLLLVYVEVSWDSDLGQLLPSIYMYSYGCPIQCYGFKYHLESGNSQMYMSGSGLPIKLHIHVPTGYFPSPLDASKSFCV